MNNTQSPDEPSSAPVLTDAQIRAIARGIDRPLVLVGMMGVGKSTIGKKLAQELGYTFADADEEIEEAAQMSVAEIFEEYGEDYFRAGERRVMTRLLEGSKCVIATGGGAFAQDDTRGLILDRGITIWLDSDVETLVDRVSRNDKRPLLHGGDVREIVTTMKAAREPAYSQAQIHVNSDDGPHGAAVERILEALEKCL